MKTNLLDFPTRHGAADVNHKDYVLRHHWKALGCKEVHKVAIDYLQGWERGGGQCLFSNASLASGNEKFVTGGKKCPIFTLQEVLYKGAGAKDGRKGCC